MDYVRIDPADVVAEHVTVRLRRDEAGTVIARVETVGTGQGGDEAVSTEGDDPPVEFALRIARELANAKSELQIDVVDPDRLWTETLGPLRG